MHNAVYVGRGSFESRHSIFRCILYLLNHARSDYEHWLIFRVRRCVVTATKPVHRLQIRPVVHNQGAPPTIPSSYIWVRALVWECGEGQTDTQADRQTDARDQYRSRVVYDGRLHS